MKRNFFLISNIRFTIPKKKNNVAKLLLKFQHNLTDNEVGIRILLTQFDE